MHIKSAEWKRFVKKAAAELSIDLSDSTVKMLAAHADELIKWNKVTNLTAITEPREVAIKHFIDSLAALKMVSPGMTVLDIGSGGGFPGIPLKIAMPELSVTLVDAARKRVNFLKHVIRTLKLTKIEAHHGRGELLAGLKLPADRFDVIICRAFTGLDKFVPMALPVLKEGGVILAMKGKEVDEELAALKTVQIEGGVTLDTEVTRYKLPVLESERSIFTIKPVKA